MLKKFVSRKFFLTVFIVLLAVLAPIIYKDKGVQDAVTMTVLGILAGVGAAYGFLNIRDSKEKDEAQK